MAASATVTAMAMKIIWPHPLRSLASASHQLWRWAVSFSELNYSGRSAGNHRFTERANGTSSVVRPGRRGRIGFVLILDAEGCRRQLTTTELHYACRAAGARVLMRPLFENDR
jgi:hypothetical protein